MTRMMQNIKIQSTDVGKDFYVKTQIEKKDGEERENSLSFGGYNETQ